MNAEFASRLKPLASPVRGSGAQNSGSDFNFAVPARSHRRTATDFAAAQAFAASASAPHDATASEAAAAAPKASSAVSAASATASITIPVRPKHTRSLSDTSLIFSPSSPKAELYSDRYIPSRVASRLDAGLMPPAPAPSVTTGDGAASVEARADDQSSAAYQMLIRSELIPDHHYDARSAPATPTSRAATASNVGSPSASGSSSSSSSSSSLGGGAASAAVASAFAASMGSPNASRTLRFKAPLQTSALDDVPMSVESRHLLGSPTKAARKIAKQPFKVLDAPALTDDFYLNLVDWSAQNVLAVGLGSAVYLWAANTGKVTRLCDLAEGMDSVTSLSWTNKGQHVAIGTKNGHVQIWDAAKCQRLRTMGGHFGRVSSMAWTSATLASGSRDQSILLRDVRSPEPYFSQLTGHKQEVCGLKWSSDEVQLASGGNDNKLCVWTTASTSPLFKFSEHQAAVKALAWSPHQNHLLASGGGTADRHIRFWNTQTGAQISSVDTGSQVCNLMWSKTCNELVSTHGYSLNQIIVWKYPSMQKLATLTGHTYRVLFLAMSPDGQNIVTGAGDETLRFWSVFPPPKNKSGGAFGNKLTSIGVTDIR